MLRNPFLSVPSLRSNPPFRLPPSSPPSPPPPSSTASRDVLGAPTEDQVDAGSLVSKLQNATIFREKSNDGGSSAAAAVACAPGRPGRSARRWESEGAGKGEGKGNGPPREERRATTADLKPSRKVKTWSVFGKEVVGGGGGRGG